MLLVEYEVPVIAFEVVRCYDHFFNVFLIGYSVNPIQELLYTIFTLEGKLGIVLIGFCTNQISEVISGILLSFNIKINKDRVLFVCFWFSFLCA